MQPVCFCRLTPFIITFGVDVDVIDTLLFTLLLGLLAGVSFDFCFSKQVNQTRETNSQPWANAEHRDCVRLLLLSNCFRPCSAKLGWKPKRLLLASSQLCFEVVRSSLRRTNGVGQPTERLLSHASSKRQSKCERRCRWSTKEMQHCTEIISKFFVRIESFRMRNPPISL